MRSAARTHCTNRRWRSLPRASIARRQRRSRLSSARSRSPSVHEADERVPFEHFAGDSERPRTAVLPLALMLLVGLLIGFGGGYVVRGRQPAAPVASSADASAPATEPAPAPVEPVDSSAARGTTSGRVSTDRPTTSAPAAAPRPATPAGAARSGTLIVRSTPSGAGVTINGKWSGRTPLTQHQLPFGDYTVRATLPGYQAKPEEVTLSADAASRTLSLQLQKEAPRAVPPAAPRPAPAAPAAPASRGRRRRKRPGRRRSDGDRFASDRGESIRGRSRRRRDSRSPARRHARQPHRASGIAGAPRVDGNGAGRPGQDDTRRGIVGTNSMKAILALENGIWYEGEAAGAPAKPAAKSSSTPA